MVGLEGMRGGAAAMPADTWSVARKCMGAPQRLHLPVVPSSCSSSSSKVIPVARPRARQIRKALGVSVAKVSLESDFLRRYVEGSSCGALTGGGVGGLQKCLKWGHVEGKARRGIVTMVIPFQRGDATQQPPPDLPSYLFKNRIVFLGMSLVPSVTELIMAELLYLQYEDPEKPIYMYINSTGTTKGGEKLGYETEAFAIYDTMRYVKPPIFTLCIGNAWGEAAMLLAAGSKGNRAALPSATIMIKQPIAQFRGQATDIDIARKEVRNIKNDLVSLYARHMGHSIEKIEEDISRPKYFTPSEAVEYGIIDKVLYSEKGGAPGGVVSDLRKAQLLS
ncbi:hypothetical protein O6H91_06G087000 [Diphasiastrum complanatum]|uniref:Uncharacterized protein n=1 Tax=Diphasiastrum complanatum TaxID=34168 RepID=A0ACC2DG94_DIPCM|nr:hypothetical protein O6H91_06G087000 [Diphasiastrum complanatum]